MAKLFGFHIVKPPKGAYPIHPKLTLNLTEQLVGKTITITSELERAQEIDHEVDRIIADLNLLRQQAKEAYAAAEKEVATNVSDAIQARKKE